MNTFPSSILKSMMKRNFNTKTLMVKSSSMCLMWFIFHISIIQEILLLMCLLPCQFTTVNEDTKQMPKCLGHEQKYEKDWYPLQWVIYGYNYIRQAITVGMQLVGYLPPVYHCKHLHLLLINFLTIKVTWIGCSSKTLCLDISQLQLHDLRLLSSWVP
jgi:hypothetical protein